MSNEDVSLDDLVTEVNEEVRLEFNKLERRVCGWSGITLGALASSPLLFSFILKDKFYMGMIIHALVILIFRIIHRLIYKKIYGEMLDYDYQWGNNSFEKVEENILSKMYRKEEITDEEFDYYFDTFDREVIDEDYSYYKSYKNKINKYSILITLLTLVPCILYALRTIKEVS